jgi:Probable zinc-ribbon domain
MEFQDKELVCMDCGKPFIWTAKEQQFYADKQFSQPKRDAACRVIKKQKFNSRGDRNAR